MLAYRRKQAIECANESTDRPKDPPPGTLYLLFLTDHMSESEGKKDHVFVESQISKELDRESSLEIKSRQEMMQKLLVLFVTNGTGILFLTHQIMQMRMASGNEDNCGSQDLK